MLDRQLKELRAKAWRFLTHRQQAYRMVFKGPVGEYVLKDLAQFCRANQTAFHEDPRIHAHIQGRQEVWLRIQQHLHLPPEKLWELTNQGEKYDD